MFPSIQWQLSLTYYANLRDEYLRYLNHEDDVELTAALTNRTDFETLLRSGKDWYGTLAASDKHIRTAKPQTLNERRHAACLPSAR